MSEPRKPGMSMIVQTVARWLKGLILMFGIYLVLYGHLTPGGGFGGGVTIACAFILVTLAAGRREGQNVFSRQAAARLDSAGLLIFLLLGWLGAWWAGGSRSPSTPPTTNAPSGVPSRATSPSRCISNPALISTSSASNGTSRRVPHSGVGTRLRSGRTRT